MNDLSRIRQIQEIQFGDQWYQRFWGSFEAAQSEQDQNRRRELLRLQAPCLHKELENATKYWFAVLKSEEMMPFNYEEFASQLDDVFADGCWCRLCRRAEPLNFFQKMRLLFSIPAERKVTILNSKPIISNLNLPKISKILGTYQSLKGTGNCPNCSKNIKLDIPDTKNCPRLFTCPECHESFQMAKIIEACI